jgi:hypothetical protein
MLSRFIWTTFAEGFAEKFFLQAGEGATVAGNDDSGATAYANPGTRDAEKGADTARAFPQNVLGEASLM